MIRLEWDGTRGMYMAELSKREARALVVAELRLITSDNVGDHYRKHFTATLYHNSGSVICEGVEVPIEDRTTFADENTGKTAEIYPVLPNGFPFAERDFLEGEIRRIERNITYFGEEISYPLRAAANAYLAYLKSRRCEINNPYQNLLDSLTGYIANITAADFAHIITHKTPNGSNTGTWIGPPTEAIIFADHFKMSLPQFNSCFSMKKGRELKAGNRGRLQADKYPIRALLTASV